MEDALDLGGSLVAARWDFNSARFAAFCVGGAFVFEDAVFDFAGG